MPIQMTIHNTGNHFTQHDEETITRLFRAIRPFLVERFPAVDTLIVVRPFASTLFQGTPPLKVWGLPHDKNLAAVNCEPSLLNVDDPEWQRQFWATTSHETQHNARFAANQSGDEKLDDTLVWDGLAGCTEVEMGLQPNQYTQAFETPAEWERAIKKAKSTINKGRPLSRQEYEDWFFGTRGHRRPQDRIKRWTGYTLGFALVAGYCNHFKMLPSQLAGTPTKQIMIPWFRGEYQLAPEGPDPKMLRQKGMELGFSPIMLRV